MFRLTTRALKAQPVMRKVANSTKTNATSATTSNTAAAGSSSTSNKIAKSLFNNSGAAAASTASVSTFTNENALLMRYAFFEKQRDEKMQAKFHKMLHEPKFDAASIVDMFAGEPWFDRHMESLDHLQVHDSYVPITDVEYSKFKYDNNAMQGILSDMGYNLAQKE